jgi:hypothetical protein
MPTDGIAVLLTNRAKPSAKSSLFGHQHGTLSANRRCCALKKNDASDFSIRSGDVVVEVYRI